MALSSGFLKRLPFLFLCLLCTGSTATATANANAQVCVSESSCKADLPDEDRQHELEVTLNALLGWVRDKGGYFNPKLEICASPIDTDIEDLMVQYHIEQKRNLDKEGISEDSDDSDDSDDSEEEEEDQRSKYKPTYSFGIFVKADATIEEGEELMRIPDDTMIWSDIPSSHFEDDVCLLADELAGERFVHDNGASEFGPYMDFLEEFVIGKVHLPMSWTASGRNILSSIVPPEFHIALDQYQRCFKHEVDDEEIPHDLFQKYPKVYNDSVETVLARLTASKLIPLCDLINHSNNPKSINLVMEKSNVKQNDESLTIQAARQISSAEELLFSYGLGTASQDQWYGVVQFGQGTAQIFRDYGFLEPSPQRWFFPAHMLDFAFIEMEEADSKTGKKWEIKWNSNVRPDDDAIFTLEQLYQNLHKIKLEMADWKDPDQQPAYVVGVNPREVKRSYDFLCNYYDVVETLLLTDKASRPESETRYQLQEETVLIDNLDNLYFQIYQCSFMTKMRNEGIFEAIETFRSAYQQIEYHKDPSTQDRCLYLDGVYQQCISYWPHYHELVVHKPAKYIKEGLKRVLWVGGGDSGVLNEFLKYPTLELAVGLELDQQVTRTAFKHFGSRPHYDNPKVQWWYGDASKSLLMLPEDYFGSFDLVIVDLSDTVFSLSVSSELDVIEAISLLLRPGGIFEMNELFMKKVSNVFEYAVHYNFNDVPKILDQAAIFASNDVDFMYQELTEHALVENATLLVEKDSMLTKHQFDRVHDYRHNPNPAFKKLCKKVQDAEEKKTEDDKPQSTAPGIMMIVEAENLTADLSSPALVRTSITNAIEKVGLAVVSDDEVSSVESPWFVIMMEEGYVVARLWAEEKYCALDIHLWSSFDSHEGLKESIVVGALGGDLSNKSTSSYRIVAGGMFGLSDWKDESKKHGPQLDQLCLTAKNSPRDQASSLEVQLQAFEICLEVLQGTGLTAVVLCGLKSDGCPSLNVVLIGNKFDQVIPIYVTEPKDGEDQRVATVAQAKETLDSVLSEKSALVDAIFYDSTSTVFANDILNMILYVEKRANLEKVFFAATVDSRGEIWRRRALMGVRDEIELDPVYRAQFLLNTTVSSLELSITASGDPLYMGHIARAVAEFQKEGASTTVEIRTILGGEWRDENATEFVSFNATFEAVAHDYDHIDATEQWDFQTPIATQTLLQFSNSFDGTPTILRKAEVITACKDVFAKRNGSSVMVYDNFGSDGAICTGNWEKGIAVVSWDGRYQVDLNIFSTSDKDELNKFENDIKIRLSNLAGWLRDIQPRGYGRVVNFKEAKMPGKSSLFVDAL